MVVSIVTSHDWDGLQAEGDWKEPEAMKNLIQRTKKCDRIGNIFEWVGVGYIEKNLKRQSKKRLSFFIFTLKPSVSDAGADEKSYPATAEKTTE